MRLRLSTNLTLALLFALLVGLSQWMSYRLSHDLLEEAVREREIDKVKTVSRGVEGLIRQQDQNVQLVARMLSTRSDLAQALANPSSEGQAVVKRALDQAFALARVDLMELVDTSEVVLYRAQDPARRGDRASGWGVAEAVHGESSLSADNGREGVAIRAIEPLRDGTRVVGAVAVGLRLDRKLIHALSQAVGAELALLGRNGKSIASTDRLSANIDLKAMAEAFEKKIPIYREDQARRLTRVYLPVLVVDDGFVMMAEVDSASAYRLLDQASQRSAMYAAAILGASILLGILMLRITLQPLRALRARAELTARTLTGETVQARGGDEVAAVVDALDALTERMASAKNALDQALGAMDDGFLLCDAQGRITSWNRRYLQLFPHLEPVISVGLPFRGLADIAARNVLPDASDAQRDAWIEARMRSHAKGDSTFEMVTADGRTVVASERRTPDGGVVSVYHDITDVRQHETALTNAKAAADAANLAKSQFLSSMSHEIRTPLNGVLGMAELLQHTRLDADQARYAAAIASAGRALHSLLGDILDLAKIEEGKIELEQTDFAPLQTLSDIASVYRELASAAGTLLACEFDADSTLQVCGDPMRFRQIVTNLLGNALKFTERGSVTLSCQQLPPRASDTRTWLRVRVQDTGVGISPEKLAQLFQRFKQADASTTRQFGGSGLGLVITKHLLELMGGEIHAESQPGRGSTFWFDLPFDAPRGRHAPDPLVQRVALRGSARILVAEDNLINQQVVQSLLGHMGASVRLVANGEQALAAVQHEPFDLVLMDCQMPQMDGLEATRRIRAWEQARDGPAPLRIVALTANALAGDREACLAAGMDDYLSKPVTSAKLAAVLERHLGVFSRPAAHAPAAPHDAAPVPAGFAGPIAPVFDPSVLAALPMVADGSMPGFADEMLDLFSSTTRTALDSIDTAHASGRHDQLVRLVHTLKSSSAQVGALALSALAGQLEKALRSGAQTPADWPRQVRDAFDRLQLQLQASPSTTARPRAPPP